MLSHRFVDCFALVGLRPLAMTRGKRGSCGKDELVFTLSCPLPSRERDAWSGEIP